MAWLNRRGIPARAYGFRSRKDSLETHGEGLADFVEGWLGSVPRLGIVTHSMGGLVARAYLGGPRGCQAERVRMVQIAPPNQGSQLARAYRDDRLFKFVYRRAGEELDPDRVAKLGPLPPHVKTLILGSGRGREAGYNRRIQGDDDGLVALSETYLEGAQHEEVRGLHSLLQWRPSVLRRALDFIQHEE